MTDPSNIPTTPTRKERDQTRHRREILAVAEALFAENGYFQTTMQMIADRAEFSVGYLYKHFAGKEEMYQEMVLFHLNRMDELLTEVESRGLSPLEEIRCSYREICSHFNLHRNFMRIFHEEVGGEFRELVETKRQHLQSITAKLTRAQEAGELRPYDPLLLAAAIQGATKELFGEMAERSGDNPFDTLPEVLFSLLIDPLRS